MEDHGGDCDSFQDVEGLQQADWYNDSSNGRSSMGCTCEKRPFKSRCTEMTGCIKLVPSTEVWLPAMTLGDIKMEEEAP